LQDRLNAFLNFIRQLGPLKLAIGGTTLFAFLLLFSVYVFKISSTDMDVLYSGLDPNDRGRITSELDARNIPYRIENEGDTLKVPSDKVLKTRLVMAGLGLPNQGSMVGYEIFDKEETLGTTNFLQNVKLMRALEGELTRTISSFDSVAKVRVHLVIPQREVFSKDRQEPRASVILKLKGRKFGKTEVNSISHLLVTAVPGLDLRNITIVDTTGRSLKLGGEDEDGLEGLSGNSTSEEYRINYETRLSHTIEDLLERSLGAGKVRAKVSAEINFDRIVTSSEIYDPDSAVIRSVQSIEERERTPLASEDNLDISIANNLPGNASASDIGGGMAATVEKTDETKNYEISKTVKNEISEAGAVCKISVAVLVDGTYKKDPETGERSYIARSDDELKQVESLVKAVIGYNEQRQDKVEVVNMAFMDEINLLDAEDHWLRDQLPSLFQSLILAVIVVLIFLTIIRPLALKLFSIAEDDKKKDMIKMEDDVDEDEIEVSLVQKNVQAASVKKVNEVLDSHPDEALMVLRRWLNSGN